MFGNPRYGVVGLVGVPLYVFTEALAPLFELLAVLPLVAAAWLGVVSWQLFAVVLGLMAFSIATLTSAAVLLDDRTSRDYRIGSLLRLTLLAPLDLFLSPGVDVGAGLRHLGLSPRAPRLGQVRVKYTGRTVASGIPRIRGSTLSRA